MSEVGRLNIVAALLVTALEVAIFMFGMRQVAPPMLVRPIAVRLVTLPVPIPAEAMPMIETEPPPPAQPMPPPDAMPMIETVAPTPLPPVPVSVTKAAPPRQRMAHARPNEPRRQPSTALASSQPRPSAPPSSLPGGGTMGARAIYKPMPEIPEELRRHPMNLVAVARFRVAADGGASVELIRSTPNPVLNTVLLAALRLWRFFPAMANGRPIAAIIDIRIPIDVR